MVMGGAERGGRLLVFPSGYLENFPIVAFKAFQKLLQGRFSRFCGCRSISILISSRLQKLVLPLNLCFHNEKKILPQGLEVFREILLFSNHLLPFSALRYIKLPKKGCPNPRHFRQKHI